MNHKMFLILNVLIIVTVHCSLAQEQPKVSDLLWWFPAGTYEMIHHENRAAMEKSESYNVYRQFKPNYSRFNDNMLPLPLLIRDNWESFTSALQIKLLVRYEPSGEMMASRTDNKGWSASDIGGRAYMAESVGQLIGVYRFADLDSFIKDLEKTAAIVKTEHVFDKRHVYTYNSKQRFDFYDFYIYPSAFQELLISRNLDLLKNMIATGLGNAESILESGDYRPLEDIFPDLGPVWTWHSYINHKYAMLKKAQKDGVDPAEIDERRSDFENAEVWNIKTHLAGKTYTLKEISFVGSEEIAKRRYEWAKSYVPKPEHMQNKDSLRTQALANKWLLDGHFVISTTEYDESLVESLTHSKQKEKEQRQKEFEEFMKKRKPIKLKEKQ